MSADDEFIGGLEKLLDKLPGNYGLPEWRHLFRRVAYTYGMRVLKTFPETVTGPVRSYPAGGGPTGPIHPSFYEFLCVVQGDCHGQQQQPTPPTPPTP